MIELLNGGFQSSVQDYPGRMGYWDVGVPPSGPMDSLGFRISNRLVGNQDCAAGIEITLQGPTIKFHSDTVIALTGAKFFADIDGQEAPWWTTIPIAKGSVLTIKGIDGPGCRGYLAVAGGIDVPLYLGSRSTFPKGRFGGFEGRFLKAGDKLPIGNLTCDEIVPHLKKHHAYSFIPKYETQWEVGMVIGPHAAPDYFTLEDEEMIFSTSWKFHFNSNRLGYRMEGPDPKFARPDGGDGGAHPSNLVDYPYAMGTVNFTGNMPILFTVDSPSMGGFVSFMTAPAAELWKVGQAKPGDHVRFKKITVEQALELQRWQDSMIGGITPTC